MDNESPLQNHIIWKRHIKMKGKFVQINNNETFTVRTHTHIFIDTFKHFYLYTRQSMNASGGTLLIQCQVQVKLINLQHKFLVNNRMNGSVLL